MMSAVLAVYRPEGAFSGSMHTDKIEIILRVYLNHHVLSIGECHWDTQPSSHMQTKITCMFYTEPQGNKSSKQADINHNLRLT